MNLARFRIQWAVCSALVCLMAASAAAQEKNNISQVPPMAVNGVTVKVVSVPGGGIQPAFVSSQKVHVDPKTGKFVEGEHDESSKLTEGIRALIDRPIVQLQPVLHPNGMISIDLQGAFLNLATASVDKHGKLVLSCEKAPPAGATRAKAAGDKGVADVR